MIGPEEWRIDEETRQWVFPGPTWVHKLHDRFRLDFHPPGELDPSVMRLIPFDALSSDETRAVEALVEPRHPLNAPGDFYGVSSECSCFGACMPAEDTPELVGYQEQPEGCFFTRQPEGKQETDRAVEAVLLAFVENLRYGGSDPSVLSRIRAATRNLTLDFCQDDLCDYPREEPATGAA